MKNYFLLIGLTLVGIMVSSCGQKGDLVRPQPPTESAISSQEIPESETTSR